MIYTKSNYYSPISKLFAPIHDTPCLANSSKNSTTWYITYAIILTSNPYSATNKVVINFPVDLTTDETEIELPPVTLEVTETPPEYFLRLKEIQEALRCAIPQVLKDRVAFPDCFHDLVAQYFNESRREDFNNQVFAHEFLNDPRFLELIGRTRKFLPLQPEKMLTEVLGSRNGK